MADTWSRKKVLITGAGGFIGSHLTERLASLGASTRALVRYSSTGSVGWLEDSPSRDDIEFVHGDILDPDIMRTAVADVDVIFHLAALIAIPYSYLAPESYVRTNIQGSLQVFQAALRAGTSRVIHTSTSEVYGSARYLPIDESHPLQGQSPYSASKIGADKIAEAFHSAFDLPVVTVRPFNTFGPRQSARAIIPTVISQCLTREAVHLGSLHPTRDFTFVVDTVEGFIAAASVQHVEGKTINLGTGKEVAIGEIAKRIIQLVGTDVEVVTDPERIRPVRSEVDQLCASNELARDILGWKPSHSLEAGLEQTIEWIRGNPGVFRPDSYTR